MGMSRFLLRSGVPPFQANQPEERHQATGTGRPGAAGLGRASCGRGAETRVRVSAIPEDLIPSRELNAGELREV